MTSGRRRTADRLHGRVVEDADRFTQGRLEIEAPHPAPCTAPPNAAAYRLSPVAYRDASSSAGVMSCVPF